MDGLPKPKAKRVLSEKEREASRRRARERHERIKLDPSMAEKERERKRISIRNKRSNRNFVEAERIKWGYGNEEKKQIIIDRNKSYWKKVSSSNDLSELNRERFRSWISDPNNRMKVLSYKKTKRDKDRIEKQYEHFMQQFSEE